MPRGNTVANMLIMLKAEIGDFSGTNSTRDSELIQLMSNMQQRLLTEHYWPFMERWWDISCPPGIQYLTLPSNLDSEPTSESFPINLDELPTVQNFWNNIYQPVEVGINWEQYNSFNFALGQQSDPIQRWRLATNPNEPENPNVFEVWPVPVTTQTLRFTGERVLQSFVAPTDTADLDDTLIVLFVAAEKIQRSEKPDWQTKLTMAQRRLQWLKQGYTPKRKRRCLDGGQQPPRNDIKLVGIAAGVKG
jgi:hypothetical protein